MEGVCVCVCVSCACDGDVSVVAASFDCGGLCLSVCLMYTLLLGLADD